MRIESDRKMKLTILVFAVVISSLKIKFTAAQNRFVAFAPFVERLIKQKADTIVESEYKIIKFIEDQVETIKDLQGKFT